MALTYASGSNRSLEGGKSWIVGGDIKYPDSSLIEFGTGTGADTLSSYDASLTFDGTSLILDTETDDLLFEIGDSATTQLSWDVKIYGGAASGASYWYFDASADLLYTTGVDMQFKDNDVLAFGTGAGAAGDVSMVWDTSNLIIKATADDTLIEIGDSAATQKSFDVTIYGNAAAGADQLLWDASASKLYTAGAAYIGGRTDDDAGRGIVLSVRTTSSALTTSGAVTGSIVFSTADDKLYVFDGSAWKSSAALT